MANIGNFEISVQAKIEGYQSELNKLKQALSRVGQDTELGKGLAKEFQKLEKDVENFSKHLTQRISSESQITKLTDQVNDIDSAFIKLGHDMQNVKTGDLKFDALTSSTQQLIKDLQEAQQALEKTFNQSFREAAKDSKELQDAFKLAGVNLNTMSADKIGDKLANSLQNAQKELQKTTDKINELKQAQINLEGKLNAAEGSVFNTTNAQDIFSQYFDPARAKQASNDIASWVDEIKAKLSTAIAGMKDSSAKEHAQNMIEGIVPTESKDQIKDRIADIIQEISNGAKNLNDVRNQFNISNKTGSKASIVEAILGTFDFKNFDLSTLKGQLEEFMKQFGDMGLTEDQKNKLMRSITGFTEQDIDSNTERIISAFERYRGKLQKEILSMRTELSGMQEESTKLTTKQNEQQTNVNTLTAGNEEYIKTIKGLEDKVASQEKRIEKLETDLRAALEKGDAAAAQAGRGAVESGTKGLQENTKAAQQYTQQLERVKEAEKMVGKIEGIAQRWFSVYAAVRMVTNAINSMKQTIAELDKTITEIAIVTNMSQGDLWGQMGTYTAMAREYASSISGVYKVSQLYYQQGLQTKEVMELTEQTLKMARISGLDYAEATNYMTNAVRSFKMEMGDAQRVVDVYSAIAAKSATDVAELAVAMSKTASSAEAVGSSFENTTAMMAVMIEATRESSQNIGSAMKSIISRYGEMKADPSKMVDSEGEEMSLNKVDTALRSVGISIQNAQGQFRDFDDVIMELAEAWDTIDINTQRYIATVMAGNRQQSRFLALVSNGERLKQLSEEAANAENASQLQFLKTLDSIEAKSQQLQTSLQSLYTQSGLENFYKGILDVSNTIIKTFTDMPTFFNLPIPAIINFGSNFYTIASIVKTVIQLVINEIAFSAAKVKDTGEELVKAESNQNNTMLQQFRKFLRDKENAYRESVMHMKAIAKDPTAAINDTEKAAAESGAASKVQNIDQAKLGLQIGSLIATGVGMSLKNTNNRGAQWTGGALSALGQGAQFAAMASAGGPGAMAAAGLAGTVLGVVQNIDSLSLSSEKYLQTVTEISDSLRNEALLKQAESKSLQSSVDKLKELEKARYTSVEAEQAYAEACDTLAKQYPELISYYDESGKAIIDTANASQLLTSSLQQTTAALINSAAANLTTAKAQKEKDNKELDKTALSTKSETTNVLYSLLEKQSVQELGEKPKDLLEADQLDIQKYIQKHAGAHENGHNTSELFSFITGENKQYDQLLNEYMDLKEEELLNWFEKNKEVFTNLANDTSSEENQKLGKVFLALGTSLNVYSTGVEASFNRINSQIESDVKTVINSLYSEEKNAGTEVFKEIEKVEGVFSLIQDLAVEQIGTAEDYADENSYKAALKQLNIKDLWDKIYNSLPNEKTIEDFGKLISQRSNVSKDEFIKRIEEFGIKTTDKIYNALLEYYDDIYNFDKFKSNNENTAASQFITTYQYQLKKLSDKELQGISEYIQNIENQFDAGKLTANQRDDLLEQYFLIWQKIGETGSITDENKEAAQRLLLGWDQTREGLIAVQDGLKEIPGAANAIDQVGKLIPLISQNLNTTFQTLASSISSKVKDFKDISQLSKGVEIDKAIKYAEELGLSFADLQLDYSTGLFKLGDMNDAYKHYFDKINDQIINANKQLELFQNQENQDLINQLIAMTPEQRDITKEENQGAREIYDKLGKNELNAQEVNEVIDAYNATKEKTETFDQWLIKHYQELSEKLQVALSDAKARAELNAGNITNFVMQAIGVSEEIAKIIANSLISEGGFNKEAIIAALGDKAKGVDLDLLEKYGISIADALGETAKGVYDKAIESITKGREVQVPVTEANQAILEGLDATIEDGLASINWSDTNISNYRKQAAKIIADGTLSNEEKDNLLASLETAVKSDNASDIFDSAISNYSGFGLEIANKLARITGKTIEELNLAFDTITGEYSIGLQQLREIISKSDKLTLKDKNKKLAEIDKEIRDTSVQTTFSDLVKNANNLSEDAIRAFADSIGENYEAYADLWRQKDGTYKIDLTGLVQKKKILEQDGAEFAAGVLDSVIDEYLGQLSNISQAQTSGYTNLSDMRAVADQFANGDLGIFQWDKELKAYTLTNEGVMRQAKAAADQLKSLDENSQEYKKAWQLMQADGQALAENIDFLSLVSAVGTDDYSDAVRTFNKSVADYNAYLIGTGQQIRISALNLHKAAKEGGLAAVRAAQDIAEQAGKKLEGSDIETIYRSNANKINNAIEQINLSIGSVIDSSTVKLLGLKDEVSDLGSGKYVIKSTIDVVNAYKKIYEQMNINNGTTLSEFNALWAKIKNEEEQTNLIDSLSNLNEMSYDTLAQIANNIGMAAEDLYATLQTSGSMQNLGGGKIRITDFDYFANLIGLTDKSSEAYIQTLSKYNDEVINYNRSRADAVVGELKAVSEAKAGDQINITNLYKGLSEGLQNSLELLIAGTGAKLENGILNINDASIPQILGILRDAVSNFDDIAARDKAEIEDAFEALLNNITEAIKQGLEGKLSNVGKVDLQDSLKSAYGVELKDSDFAKTADGFKMTEQAAIRVYNTMKDIDALQASLVLTELNNSLKEANENYESMGDIMNHIAQLEKEINDPEVSSARKEMYQQELEVAKEIAQVRATTDDKASFDFMNNKLPGSLENPLTYAENWGKAINILQKGSGDKKGFIDARDWYNIVNEMNNIAGIGENIKMYGVELDGSLEAASELIQKGYNALKSIDGGKMQVDLSQLGVSFEQGAMDMKGSVTEGIHAMAQSQIDMLDGLIAVLETVVAMEEAFAGLKASEDNKLDFGELFKDLMPTDDLKTAAERLLEKFPNMKDPNNPLTQIKINGETLAKLLEDAKNGVKFSEENAHGLAAAMDALYQAMLSGNYDLDNIYESVKEVLQQSGLINGKLSIDIGTTTLYLTGNVITQIDWGSDKVKEAVKNAFGEKNNQKGQTPEQQAREAMEEFSKNPQQLLKEGDTNSLKFILSVSSEVTIDEEKNYVVDGHPFKDEKEAYQALLLKKSSKNAKITVDEKGKLTGAVIEGKEGAKVQITIDAEGNTEYTYQGPNGTATGGTPHEAIRNYFRDHQEEWEGLDNLGDIVHKKAVELGISSSTGITFGGKDQEGNKTDKPTLTQSRMAQDLLNDPNIKTYEELRQYSQEHPELGIEVDSSLKGDLSLDDMKKIAEIFGVDYAMEAKEVSLSITMTDTPEPLQNLLNGTNATLNAELNVTKINANGLSTEGAEGENGENAIKVSGPVELAANPLNINPGTDTASGGSTAPIPIKGAVELTPTSLELAPSATATTYTVENIFKVSAPIGDLILTGESNSTDLTQATAKASTNTLTAEGLIAALKLTGESSSTDLSGVTPEISTTALNATGKIAALMLTDTSTSTDLTGVTSTASTDTVDAEGGIKDLTLTGSPNSTDVSQITGAKSEGTVDAGAAAGALLLWYAAGTTDPEIITGGPIDLTDEEIKAASDLAELSLKYVAGGTTVDPITGLPAEGIPGGIINVLAEIGHILLNDGSTEGGGSIVGLSAEFKQKVATLVNSIATAQNLTPEAKYSAYAQIKEIIAAPTSDGIKEKLINDIISKFGLNDLKTELQTVEVPVEFKLTPTIPGENDLMHKLELSGGVRGDINANGENGLTGNYLKNVQQAQQYGELSNTTKSNIEQIQVQLEMTGSPLYDKYFDENGNLRAAESKENTVNVKPDVKTNGLPNTEKGLVEEGKADTDLTTNVSCEIGDNSSVLQDLLTDGVATVELTVNVHKTGDSVPGEDDEGGNGPEDESDSGDSGNSGGKPSENAKNTGEQAAAGVGTAYAAADLSSYTSQFSDKLIASTNSDLGIASPAVKMMPSGEQAAAGVGKGMQEYDFSADAAAVAESLISSVTESLDGLTGGLGEKLLSVFSANTDGAIEGTTEALQALSETDAVSNPGLSNTLGKLAKEALEICGVDAGQLERLYHILENLPGAANTFANNADWKKVVEIIRQLSGTNKGGEGEGGEISLNFTAVVDPFVSTILSLIGKVIPITLKTDGNITPPEGNKNGDNKGNNGDTDNNNNNNNNNNNENDQHKGEKTEKEEPKEVVGESKTTAINGKTGSSQGKSEEEKEEKPLDMSKISNGGTVGAQAHIIGGGVVSPKTPEEGQFTNIDPLTGQPLAMQAIESMGRNSSPYGYGEARAMPKESMGETPTSEEGELKVDTITADAVETDEVSSESPPETTAPAPAPEPAETPAPTPAETPEVPEMDTSGIEAASEAMTAFSEAASGTGEALSTINSGLTTLNSGASAFNSNVTQTGTAITTATAPIQGAVQKLGNLKSAIDRIPNKTTIGIEADVGLEVHVSSTKDKGDAAGSEPGPSVSISFGEAELAQDHFVISRAKGSNLALPTGTTNTLMGELGPELVVTNGHYMVVGQGGAEFVDLPNDSIVFNHEKTAQLLKHGHTSRGKPLTNSRNAISFAKGNIMGGPAMASASAALAALKQLRAMWQSLLNASAKDLGSQAGRGGGGGKDDNDDEKFVQPTTTTADIQRWYNWLRQIEKIEKDITYQEKLQKKYESDRIANGQKIFDTQKERLKLLDQEIIRNEKLAELQKSWYDNKRKELAESSYGKIFTYDENGLQQYVGSGKPGSGLGLDILENLTRRTVEGEAKDNAATSKAQLQYLNSIGFNINDLIYNDDGTKVVKAINTRTMGLTRMPDDEDTPAEELYTKLMDNFWARVDGWRDELDSLYDSYQDQLAKVIDNQNKQNEIIKGFVKNELDVEKKLLDAIENREQAIIDKLEEEKDALEKSTSKFINGITDALNKQKEAQEANDEQEELSKLQRQLSILQRSGGSASQIKQLQDQITQKQQDMYYQGRQDEIDAIQDAADKQIEKLDQQIEILNQTLDYQKSNGLLWNQVREIMAKGEDAATAFYDEWVVGKSGKSALQQGEDLRSFRESFQEWIGYREYKEETKLEEAEKQSISDNSKYKPYLESMSEEERTKAETAAQKAAAEAKDKYLKEHAGEEGAEEGARQAAQNAYNESVKNSYINADSNKEGREQFAKSYEDWLQNRRISDENDFTNTDAFKAHQRTFKSAMQEYYLAHQGEDTDENIWQAAIEAGRTALEKENQETYESALETVGTVNDKNIQEWGYNAKNKWAKLKNKAYANGASLQFDDARIEGTTHYLHVKGEGANNGWVQAAYINGGENIWQKLTNRQQLEEALANGNLDALTSDLGTEFYKTLLGHTAEIGPLNAGSIKFGGSKLQTANGDFIEPSKRNNRIVISDLSGLTWNKHNKATDPWQIKSLKNITVKSLQTEGGQMIDLKEPFTFNADGTIKKYLNDLLKTGGNWKNLFEYMNKYATGGMNYTTGPAWLDGTKTKPEAVLNAAQTSFLRNDLLGNQKDSLKSIVLALQDSINNTATGDSTVNDGMVIENIEVTFEAGTISSDYDMKRASAIFKDELVKLARKSGNRSVTRR